MYGLAFSAVGDEEGVFQFLPFIQATGADWDKLNDPGAARAAAFWQKLLDEKLASPDTLSHRQSEAAATFINGNAAMDINGPWELMAVEKKGAKFKWRVALLPPEKSRWHARLGLGRTKPCRAAQRQKPASGICLPRIHVFAAQP